MQILRTFLVVGAVVCVSSFMAFAAPDSPSQAQAREAVRKKLAELKAQETVTEAAVPQSPAAVKPAAPAPKPQPVVQAPAPTITPAPAAVVTAPPSRTPMVGLSPEEITPLREVLHRKIAELNAQEKAGQPAPSPAKPATDQKAAVAEAKARQAQKGKMKSAVSPAAQLAPFAPAEPPPSAVPAAKEAKLAELLRQYKADAITPEEYHKARTKILAEP